MHLSQLAIDPHNRSKGVDIAMDYYDLPSFAIVTSVALRYGDASDDVRAAGRAIDIRESMDPLARLKVWKCLDDLSLFAGLCACPQEPFLANQTRASSTNVRHCTLLMHCVSHRTCTITGIGCCGADTLTEPAVHEGEHCSFVVLIAPLSTTHL